MDTKGAGQEISRRQVLSTAGLAAVAVPVAGRRPASALVRTADTAGAPGPEQVHVQFGADAASQVAVSWATEPAPWSAYRDLQTPYGFASFDFVPHEPGGTTSITVTHCGADAGSSVYSQRDQFVMRKPLGRGRRHDQLAGTATAS